MNPWTPDRHESLFTWAQTRVWDQGSIDLRLLDVIAALREIERLQEQELKLKGQVAQLECSVETLAEELKSARA